MRENRKKNQTKELINEKPLELNEEIWKENQKIKDIVNKKSFQLGLERENKKPSFVVRRGTLVT